MKPPWRFCAAAATPAWSCSPAKSLRRSPSTKKFGGVVPEVASRNHLVHAPRLLERATRSAKIDMSNVDAFAATSGPGLASSLMIGASIAKGLAIGFGNLISRSIISKAICSRPFSVRRIKPNVSLIVSGGHTMSILVRSVGDYQIIGRTVDDAAGEAFDKVAKMLGLGYPGGPEIEKRARAGDPKRFDLPRSMLDSDNFSFSGLKTAVRYLLPKIGVIPNGWASGLRSPRKQGVTNHPVRDPSLPLGMTGCR